MFIFTKIKQIILLFGDIALLFFSLYLTLYIRFSQAYIGRNWQMHFYPFVFIYFIWVAVFYSQNLYNLNFAKNNLFFFKTLFESFIINILITSFFFYFTPFFGIAPKTNLFLDAIIAGVLLFLWRALFNILMAKYIFKNRIVFLGYSKEVKELICAFKNEPQLGYETAGVVNNESIGDPEIKQLSAEEMTEGIKKMEINTVAIHYGGNIDKETNSKLYRLIFSNITFVNLLKLYEEITGKLPIETLTEGWFLNNLQESEKKIYDRLKIVTDYILAAALGAVLAIIFLPVAFLMLVTNGRPIFYTQTRVGKNGKTFKIYKFRTMIKDAESAGAQFADKNDSRITAFGKFLRRTRVDELPQVVNVLKGEMSFIGPRPERPEFVEELTQKMPFYPLRHLAKPGLTGWAQINFPYAGNIEENIKKLQYDIYYIKNRSLLLDVATVLKTFNIVIRFRGR